MSDLTLNVIFAVIAAGSLALAVYEFRARRRLERRDHVRRKLELARQIKRVNPRETLPPSIMKGNLPAPEGQFIRELATLLDYRKDGVARDDVDRLLRAFREAEGGKAHSLEEASAAVAAYERVQMALAKDEPRWEREVANLSR